MNTFCEIRLTLNPDAYVRVRRLNGTWNSSSCFTAGPRRLCIMCQVRTTATVSSHRMYQLNGVKSQLPHKIVNFKSSDESSNNELTNCVEDLTSSNYFINTFCEMISAQGADAQRLDVPAGPPGAARDAPPNPAHAPSVAPHPCAPLRAPPRRGARSSPPARGALPPAWRARPAAAPRLFPLWSVRCGTLRGDITGLDPHPCTRVQ